MTISILGLFVAGWNPAHTHTHTHTHSSYMTSIGMHSMHLDVANDDKHGITYLEHYN